MNKRILQLAASHFPRDGEGNISATPEMIIEFAELIVRECAGITDDNLIPDYPITGAVYDGIQSKKILEHFGVGE